MEHENGDDRFADLEERFAGYEVYDNAGEKIGGIDLILADKNGRPEYVGVKTSSQGAGSPLIPVEAVRVDEGRRVIEVPLRKGKVEGGPSYHDDREVTSDFEQRVRRYYGLREAQADPEARGSYTDHRGADDESLSGPSGSTGRGTTIGEREVAGGREDLLGDTGELRVQRSEEELRVDTRQREAGRMNVRKKVRTEREQVRVPKRREEIDIERVPGEGREASGVEIGEDDEVVVVQVFEEEVVVSKRTVLKEEIRIRKRAVEDEEVVEVDLRKEEVDIEDTTGRDEGWGTARGTGFDDEAGRRGR